MDLELRAEAAIEETIRDFEAFIWGLCAPETEPDYRLNPGAMFEWLRRVHGYAVTCGGRNSFLSRVK